jgi:hypothetical protein
MQMWQHHETAASLATWGVALPIDAQLAGETWQVIANLKVESPIEPLRAALQAGDIGPGDVLDAVRAAATTLAASERAQDIVRELDYPLSQRFHAAISANVDSIIGELQPHFAAAADRLAAAARVLPQGAKSDDVLSMGHAAMTAWHNLGNAAGALDALAAIHTTLTNVYGPGRARPAVAAFLDPDVSYTAKDIARADYLARGYDVQTTMMRAIELADRGDGAQHWSTLVRNGLRLHLNTGAEVQRVLAAAADEQPVGV